VLPKTRKPPGRRGPSGTTTVVLPNSVETCTLRSSGAPLDVAAEDRHVVRPGQHHAPEHRGRDEQPLPAEHRDRCPPDRCTPARGAAPRPTTAGRRHGRGAGRSRRPCRRPTVTFTRAHDGDRVDVDLRAVARADRDLRSPMTEKPGQVDRRAGRHQHLDLAHDAADLHVDRAGAGRRGAGRRTALPMSA
jgi:hypothetical protein